MSRVSLQVEKCLESVVQQLLQERDSVIKYKGPELKSIAIVYMMVDIVFPMMLGNTQVRAHPGMRKNYYACSQNVATEPL